MLSLWGANAGTKCIFDALNIIYKETEKRGFIGSTLQSMLFTFAGLGLIVLAIASVVAVPVALNLLGIPSTDYRLLTLRAGRYLSCHPVRARVPLSLWP